MSDWQFTRRDSFEFKGCELFRLKTDTNEFVKKYVIFTNLRWNWRWLGTVPLENRILILVLVKTGGEGGITFLNCVKIKLKQFHDD